MERECGITYREEEAPFQYNINNQGYCIVVYAVFKIYINQDRSSRTLSYGVPCIDCDDSAMDDLLEYLSDLIEDFNLPDYMYLNIYEALESQYMIPASNSIDCSLLPADRSCPRVTFHIHGGEEPEANRASTAAVFLQPYHGDVFTCSICLDETSESQVCVKTGCCHPFHKACLESWLGRRNTCPYCRSSLLLV